MVREKKPDAAELAHVGEKVVLMPSIPLISWQARLRMTAAANRLGQGKAHLNPNCRISMAIEPLKQVEADLFERRTDESDSESVDGGGSRRAARDRYDERGAASAHSKRFKQHSRGFPPPKPHTYSGEPDSYVFCSFVKEVALYLEDQELTRPQAFRLISRYLQGQALDFYQGEVEFDENNWTLSEFFEGLFNFCFDPDFRMLKSMEWMSLKQGGMSVQDYAIKPNRVADCFGGMEERMPVLKFWVGLNRKLQGELWMHGYRPEGKLSDLVKAARDVETAFRMAKG